MTFPQISDVVFEYIDVWSSPFTWGGSLPVQGDLVVVPHGYKILMDMLRTPVYKFVLIQG